MAVSQSILTRGRAAKSGEILEKIDCGDRISMDVKDARSFGAESYSGDIPFWSIDLKTVRVPDASDAAAEPMVIAELDQMRFKLSREKRGDALYVAIDRT